MTKSTITKLINFPSYHHFGAMDIKKNKLIKGENFKRMRKTKEKIILKERKREIILRLRENYVSEVINAN